MKKNFDTPKVLILGFSVTADSKGYVKFVKESIGGDVEVDFCGVGGVTPLCLPFVFYEINRQRGPFAHVVIDLATSVYGLAINCPKQDAIDVLYDIFYAVQSSGAAPALVNFYRSNFDYNYHYFDMIIESICARHKIPLLDLGSGLLDSRGRDFCNSLLRDTVHTSDFGSSFQGKEVSCFVKRIVDICEDKAVPAPKNFRRHKLARDFLVDNFSDRFKRSGFLIDYFSVSEGVTTRFVFDAEVFVNGVSFLSGPRSGWIDFRFSGGENFLVNSYDEHCFYERYNFHEIKNTIKCQYVDVTQVPGIPDIVLKKGEKDESSRVAKIVAFHFIEKNKSYAQ